MKDFRLLQKLKNKFFFLSIFLLIGCLFSFSKTENTLETALFRNLFASLRLHYSYSSTLNKYPQRALDLYIDNIDGSKRFFLKSDIKTFEEDLKNLDLKLKKGEIDIFHKITNLLILRIAETTNIINEVLSKPLNLETKESLEINAQKRDFPENFETKKELWRKLLKNDVLNKIILKLEREKREIYTALDEEEARQEVKKETMRMIERRLSDKNLFSRFVNSITSSFDNHTEYFPPSEKEDFDINMRGTFEGIGAQLREEGEFIKVQEIIPGGPAAKQKLLKAGDIILKVAQSNEAPVDVVNMPVSDVVRLIRGKKGTEVRLTVKKPNGQIVVISIIRGKVVLEESYAKVSLLSDKNEKFGYIYLPSFYRDFKGNELRNATEDVYLALESLKKVNVKGIILDLRNNGGGSLEDAVRISGLFFEEGPVVQVKNNFGLIQSLNDPDPKTYYDGPLAVLVNELSASASEILAAALQDYRRAIIIGSEKTFGKGTVQTFKELGYFYPSENSDSNVNLGAIKITVQKFYRINGDSTQKKGVIPDIILPSVYGYIKFGEHSLKYPLEFDTVRKANYELWPSKVDIEKIKENSKKRIETNATLNYIDKTVKLIKEKNEQPIPLNFENAKEFYKTIKKMSEELLSKQNEPDKIKAEWIDYRNSGEDEDSKIKHREWLNQISGDIYIKEVINIIRDSVN